MLLHSVLLISFLRLFGLNADAAIGNYPSAWWKPYPREDAASWEVLPQDAGPGEVILSKRTELGIFSNFANTAVVFKGKRYASLEGFWQMMKYPEGPNDPRAQFPGLKWEYTRDEVARMTAFEARRAGDKANENMKKMGISWLTFEGERMEYKGADQARHYEIIEAISWEKVRQHQEVRDLLLRTGDLILRSDHHPEHDATPAYRYFEIYMKIRSVLQSEAATTKSGSASTKKI